MLGGCSVVADGLRDSTVFVSRPSLWCTVTVAGCAEMAGVAVRGGEAATKKAAKKLAVVAWMEAADACGV